MILAALILAAAPAPISPLCPPALADPCAIVERAPRPAPPESEPKAPPVKAPWYKSHTVWSTVAVAGTTALDAASSEAATRRGARELNPVFRLPSDFHTGRRVVAGLGAYGFSLWVDHKWGRPLGSLVRYTMSAVWAGAAIHNFRTNR